MFMGKKVFLMLSLMSMMFVISCGGSSSSGSSSSLPKAADGQETFHFEIVSKGSAATYWQAVMKGIKNKTDELNNKVGYEKYSYTYVGPDSESDIAVQVQQFSSAVSKNPDALGLAALDVNALLTDIQTAAGRSIPIVGFDSGVPNAPQGAIYANASTDNYIAGSVAAVNMYPAIKDKLGAAQVRIGLLGQDATAESIVNRGLGFIDTMIDSLTADGYTVCVVGNDKYISDSKDSTATEANANVIIEVRVPAQVTLELASTEAGALLNKKDLIAIYSSNQVATEGVINANGTLNVLGADKIIAVGFDSGALIKAAVSDGTLYGAVTQAPVAIGSILVELLAASSAGESVSDTDTGSQFYNAQNINDAEISQNLYD